MPESFLKLFKKIFLLLLTGLLLQSCASTKNYQLLQQGKSHFETGNYTNAFHELLPIAVNGNPEAQYAIGYLYYYGYGVPEDSESGLFWITKAAEQHYAPAMKALTLIRSHSKEDQETSVIPTNVQIQTSQANPEVAPNPPAQEESLAPTLALHATPSDTPQPLSSPPQRKTSIKHKITYRDFIATMKPVIKKPPSPSSNKPSYTMQLFGSYDVNSVKNLQTRLGIQTHSVIYHTKHDGKNWYVLTFGHYQTSHQALLAKNQLSPTLSQFKPWIRSANTLDVA